MSLTITIPTVQAVLTGMVVGGNGYGISHEWNGTSLVVTSDSGTSSADLRGPAAAWLKVMITQTEDGTYAADKTFAEITAAFEAGDEVAAVWCPGGDETYLLPMNVYGDNAVSFQTDFLGRASMYFRLYDDDTLEMSAFAYDKVSNAVSVAAVKSDSTVTVTAVYDDGSTSESVITLDDNGDPVSVTTDGLTCTLTWEGFDE